ncbi:MAG TPA: DUF309 domain-containing protein [Holophagaceae bacterium]|nr:DUF309 domain-containing protein [Holophagaceae bacterium]
MSVVHLESPFWQRQPVLPLEIQRFLRHRIEAALGDPARRELLVWPAVLGAPGLREQHPEGLPESLLLAHAAKMLAAVGESDPEAAWGRNLAELPDTAERGAAGWRPHASWGAWGPLVSLRSAWQLMALTPLPLGERYGLACGISLFNHGLYHECHDALEPLWMEAAAPLKAGLQGLILMAAGLHHLQLHNTKGMAAVWEEALARLAPFSGRLETPWGAVDFASAERLTAERIAWLDAHPDPLDLRPLWTLPRPMWTLEDA